MIKGGDLSAVVNHFAGYFTEYLKAFIINELNIALKSVLQISINNFLATMPQGMQIGYYNLYVNKLVRTDGTISTADFWTFETDGTYYTNQNKIEFNRDLITMPRYLPDGKELQMFISEYSVNSGLRASHTLGLLRLDEFEFPLSKLD